MIESVLQKVIILFGGDGTELKAVGDQAVAKMKQVGMAVEDFGRKASLAITAPLMVAQGLSVRAFASFDDAITKSTAIMGDMTAEMRSSMVNQAKAISTESVTSATELAKTYFYLASGGKSAANSIALLSTVNSFAVAGDFEAAKATELLLDTQNALGLTRQNAKEDMEQMIRISDVYVKANIMASTSTEELATAMTNKFGISLKNTNKSLEEGTSILVAYAAAGIKGSKAGEYGDIMMRELRHTIQENSKEWKELGMTIYDSNGKMLPTADIIESMEKKFGGLSDQAKYSAFSMLGFRSESMAAIAPLLGQSKALRETQTALEGANGITKEIEKNQMSFMSEVKILANTINVLSIEVGEILAPRMRVMNELVKSAIGYWRSLSPGLKEASIYLAEAAAALGPVTIAVGMLVQNGKAIIPVFNAMKFASVSAFTAMRAAAIAAIAPILPYVLVIGAIGAAVTGVAYLIYGPEGFAHAWDVVGSAMQRFWDACVGFFENFRHNISALVTWFADNWLTILADVGMAYGIFYLNMASNVATLLYTEVRLLTAFMGWMSTAIPKAWNYLFSEEFAKAVFAGTTKVIQVIGATFSGIIELADKSVKGIGQILVNMFEATMNTIVDMGEVIREVMVGILTGNMPNPYEIMMKLAEKASTGLEKINGAIVDGAVFAMTEVIQKTEATRKELVGDFNKGAEDLNFFNTAGDIMSEQMAKMKGPLDGFKAQTLTGPDLILTRRQKDINEKIVDNAPQLDKPKFEADTKWISAEKAKLAKPVVFAVSGNYEAVEKGSAEAVARLHAYQNSVTVTQGADGQDVVTAGGGKKKHLSEKQLEDQKQMTMLLSQIAANTKKEKGEMVLKTAGLATGDGAL